jgi:hypothetical protein
MRFHPKKVKVQEQACHSLARLVRDNQNKIAIASAGAIDLIVSAMSSYQAKTVLQENSCQILCSLSSEEAILEGLSRASEALGASQPLVSETTRT